MSRLEPTIARWRYSAPVLVRTILAAWVIILLASCARQEPPGSAARGTQDRSSGQAELVAGSEKLRLRMRVVEPASLQQATALGTYISWTVQFDRDGKPFSVNSIAINGGMPSHGHGLPTQPRVTAQLGDGRYRVEGLKFSMPGRWQLVFSVGTSLGDDRIVLDFNVRH